MESADNLSTLAGLLRMRRSTDAEISKLIGRRADKGPIGEFIASEIFDIQLHSSATHRGSDGIFRGGSLAEKTVNVKMYTDDGNGLDINEKAILDYYLVLWGPAPSPFQAPRRSTVSIIESVYVFDSEKLLPRLRASGVKLGLNTSVRKEDWESAEIYPRQRNLAFQLDQVQRSKLELFGL